MVAKRHCFSCRFGTTEVKWQNADVRFKCGASSGFASLKRFSCWECYMKHRLCICGSNHCTMKADFLSSWCHRRLKEIGHDSNSKFNDRHTMTGWNADMLDVAFKWQNQWQRWCDQFQWNATVCLTSGVWPCHGWCSASMAWCLFLVSTFFWVWRFEILKKWTNTIWLRGFVCRASMQQWSLLRLYNCWYWMELFTYDMCSDVSVSYCVYTFLCRLLQAIWSSNLCPVLWKKSLVTKSSFSLPRMFVFLNVHNVHWREIPWRPSKEVRWDWNFVVVESMHLTTISPRTTLWKQEVRPKIFFVRHTITVSTEHLWPWSFCLMRCST